MPRNEEFVKNEEEKDKNAKQIDIDDESGDEHGEVCINIAKQMVAVFDYLHKDNEQHSKKNFTCNKLLLKYCYVT